MDIPGENNLANSRNSVAVGLLSVLNMANNLSKDSTVNYVSRDGLACQIFETWELS